MDLAEERADCKKCRSSPAQHKMRTEWFCWYVCDLTGRHLPVGSLVVQELF
jgi:hypothetical protein